MFILRPWAEYIPFRVGTDTCKSILIARENNCNIFVILVTDIHVVQAASPLYIPGFLSVKVGCCQPLQSLSTDNAHKALGVELFLLHEPT